METGLLEGKYKVIFIITLIYYSRRWLFTKMYMFHYLKIVETDLIQMLVYLNIYNATNQLNWK